MTQALEVPAVSPEVVELDGRQAAVVEVSGEPGELPSMLSEAFEVTMARIAASGGQVAGPPFARYQRFGERIEAEVGFPFIGTLVEDGRVHAVELSGGRGVLTTYVGPYSEIASAWSRTDLWIREHGLLPAGAPWESYLTGPDDPGQPVTQIVFPVR